MYIIAPRLGRHGLARVQGHDDCLQVITEQSVLDLVSVAHDGQPVENDARTAHLCDAHQAQYCHLPAMTTYAERQPLVTACVQMRSAMDAVFAIHAL